MRNALFRRLLGASATALAVVHGVAACGSVGAYPYADADAAAPEDAAAVGECSSDSDCRTKYGVSASPAGCAEFRCEIDGAGARCAARPADQDGDGHPTAVCKVSAPGMAIPAGDDCADDDPAIYPGAPCTAPGTPNPAVGACRPGTISCTGDAGGPTCVGAIGPAAKEDCTTVGVDDNCNGTAEEACECKPGETRPCGVAVGACKQGTQICSAAATWGACAGGVAPATRQCGTPGVDADCNGTNDVDERACACELVVPNQPPLTFRPTTFLKCDAGGERQCKPAGASSAWGACQAAAERCDYAWDGDLNGIAGDGPGCFVANPVNEHPRAPASAKCGGRLPAVANGNRKYTRCRSRASQASKDIYVPEGATCPPDPAGVDATPASFSMLCGVPQPKGWKGAVGFQTPDIAGGFIVMSDVACDGQGGAIRASDASSCWVPPR